MKNSKSLIFLKIFILLIPFICVSIFLAVFPLHFMNYEFAYYYQNKSFAESHENYARVLIMGDSAAKTAWIPKNLSDDTYNFALVGTCPIEEYYYLRNYLKNNVAPEYVILTKSINHFMETDTIWNHSVYYHRLGLSDMIEIYRAEKTGG